MHNGFVSAAHLGCIDNAADRKRILRSRKPHSVQSRRALSISHTRPARNAMRQLQSAVLGVPEVDNQVDSYELLNAEREQQEEGKQHCCVEDMNLLKPK